MEEYLAEDHEDRKKVFFKPEISSEMKFTPIISPQFINDTNLLYMSAYDFMAYNTDEESFSLLHRPLPSEVELQKSQEEFVNVNFGRSSREQSNDIFYLIKNSTEEEERYYLGRRINSVNHEYERKLIAKNVKITKKKFNSDDIDNFCNIRQTKSKPKTEKEEVPDGILEFKKEFIVKPSLSLIIFVVKKMLKEPEIKLSKKEISEEEKNNEEEIIEFENPSPPSTKHFIKEDVKEEKKTEKQYKNYLLIHSYSHHQTMTFELDESIDSAFEILPGSPNLICTTEKFIYLLNFEVRNVYVSNKINSNFDIVDKTSYQDSSRGYLNSDIKVEILDKSELEFYIQTEGMLSKNLFVSSKFNNTLSVMDKNKKKNRKNRSVAFNSIIRDRRVSSILKPSQRNSEKTKNLENTETEFSNGKEKTKSKPSNFSNNAYKIEECESAKIIKKALRILPISFLQEEFILIVYVISKVLCTGDSIETLSFEYESRMFSVQSSELFEIDLEQKISKTNTDPFATLGGGFEETHQLPEDANSESNVLKFVTELGDITTNKGVILVWEKFEPVIHEIVYKVDYRTSEMVDLSDPKNLKSQKTIYSSNSYVLEYRNKITLHLDSNLIREIIISPTSQNFLILSGRNHTKNEYHDEEYENYDIRPEDLEEKYDIDDYLIFQYDLFAELWSSDANVYLKNIPLCYQKRKVEEIAPFTLKNEVLALTGLNVHEMHKSLLDGILDFDLHAYGYFIAVSFGFNAKIYSLEHDTLNLIYTYNAQNIKKIKYSPDGSDLVIMLQKSIKILDSYSFAIKYNLQEKSPQCSFTNFSFSFSGLEFCTIYDHVFVNIHDGHSYKKVGTIKPGQSLLGAHDKIVTIIPDTEEKFCLVLLEDGKIYFKFNDDVVVIQHEKIYEYSDGKKINCVHYDSKRGVLFCGLEKGIVRAHIWPIKNEATYSFNTYSEFKFGYSLITVIKSSILASIVYIGDMNGNLTTSKFLLEKEKKFTGEIRPNNYYINASFSPMMNLPRSELDTMEKCYKYVLGSSAVSEDGEKMKLEYKLNEIITKMNIQMKNFKTEMREKLIEKEAMARCKINFSKLYNQEKSKLTVVSHELKYLREKEIEEKSELVTTYESDLKKIIEEQNELIKEKGLELSKNMMAKTFLKQMHLKEYNELKEQEEKVSNEYNTGGLKGIELKIREEELVPYDEIDYVPEGFSEVKKELIKKLEEQLIKEQERNYQLKQEGTYMENAISNLQMTGIKLETLQFRVTMELKEMEVKLEQQNDFHQNLKEELKDAENKINHTQANVLHRNPQFSKSIEGSSNDDACTYKLWVKDKMVQEVELLFDHFNNLNEIMEQKQQDIIDMVTYKKKILDSFESLTKKKADMKVYIHELKDYLKNIKNQISQLKFQSLQYEFIQETNKEKFHRNEQLKNLENNEMKESANEDFRPLKLKLANLAKNQSKEKSQKNDKMESQRSKSKNQTVIVNNKHEAHQIMVQNLTNRRVSQKDSLLLENFKVPKRNVLEKSDELSKYAKEKVDRIVEEIDKKVKNEWKTLEGEKSNMQATSFRSSSQKSLTKRWKKSKCEKKLTENSNSFSFRLLERLREKEEEENELQKNEELKKNSTEKERVIPFSATSSPQIKKISSNFNLFEKSNKFFKNNVKIQQRKAKRLNGEKAELICEFEELRFENKELSDKQALIKEGIEYLNEIHMNEALNESFRKDNEESLKMLFKTPFQKYVEQKGKMSPNNTLSSFKVREKKLRTSQSSRNNFNMTSTAYNSPRNTSPIKHSESLSFFKKK